MTPPADSAIGSRIRAAAAAGALAASQAASPNKPLRGRALGLVALEGALGTILIQSIVHWFEPAGSQRFSDTTLAAATGMAVLAAAMVRGYGEKGRLAVAVLAGLLAVFVSSGHAPMALRAGLESAAIFAGAATLFATISAHAAANRPLWRGPAATLRQALTPVSLGGAVCLAAWASARAEQGQKLGGVGALLVLAVFAASLLKLAMEGRLFGFVGPIPTALSQSARLLTGPLAGSTALRFLLGGLGGVVLPLTAQMLSFGSKNIPAVTDPSLPATVAAAALACLIPAEVLERRLFYQSAVADGAEERSE